MNRKWISLVVTVTIAMCCLTMTSTDALAQTPNGTLDFGNVADGTTATTGNTGFGGVRIGSGGGSFTLQNPGQEIGSQAELKGIASSSGSINSVGVTSTEYGTATQVFSIAFEVYFSGGSSGTWYFFAGNGATFGSAQSSGFSGSEVFTGLRFAYGTSSTITTNNRGGSSWSATGITGTPFAQNAPYTVSIIGNNSASTVNYGNSQSIAANKYDLWVNGALVGDDLSKALLSGTTNINAFRFYGENSTGNVATIAIDNIRWWNQAVAPSMSIYSTIPTVSSNTYTDLNVNSGSASLSGDVTVDRVLTLAGGDITTGSNTLTLGSSATSSGDYDVVGNVKRSSFTTGSSYSFGNPNVTVNFASADILPTDVTVTLAKTQPTGFPYAVDRTYTVAGTGGSGYSATLRLRYKDSELHLNPPATESNLYILKYSGGAWVKQTRSNIDTTNNWVETSGVTSFSDWTISGNTPTALHLRTLTARPAPSPLALALPLLGLAALGGGLLARRRRAA